MFLRITKLKFIVSINLFATHNILKHIKYNINVFHFHMTLTPSEMQPFHILNI